jgi:hypothetical protein
MKPLVKQKSHASLAASCLPFKQSSHHPVWKEFMLEPIDIK